MSVGEIVIAVLIVIGIDQHGWGFRKYSVTRRLQHEYERRRYGDG